MSKKVGWDLGAIWCGLMHDSVMWPIHGKYQCRTCGRRYPALEDDSHAEPHRSPTRRPLFGSAVLFLLAVLAAAALARPLHADARNGSTDVDAAIVFGRYVTGTSTARWSTESLDIDAALPKLGKRGRLQAIRRIVPFGQTKYQVLELTGDPTVKEQVIVRYLKAEQRAAEMPAVAVSIIPANYKFAYKGPVAYGNRLAYAFQITPRKKREGLIKGELWLDAETAVPVHESGYFVKNPSVFIKRIEVTQDSEILDGTVELRLTHVSVNTRLVGRAELAIQERPLNSADDMQVAGSGEVGE
jgi:hypothetical protein